MSVESLLHRVEPVLRGIDRIAGGRKARLRVPETTRVRPTVRRAHAIVAWCLAAELVIAAGAVGVAIALTDEGRSVPGIVWYRLVVIFAITATLFYFLWRAWLGWWWAYSRLRLFSVVFPVIALGTCAIPGLYPPWMIVEQVVFSAVLVGVAVLLWSAPMRTAYAVSAATEVSSAPVRPGSHPATDSTTRE